MIRSSFGIGPNGLAVFKSGSGLLIDDGRRRSVLTAAHNLYDHGVRRSAVWVSARFEANGDDALASRSSKTYFVPNDFKADPSAPPQHDFAVFRIKPLGADRFTGVQLALSNEPSTTRKMIVGYPNEGLCKGSFRPYRASFSVQPSGPSNYDYIDQDTYVGMSGAPLLATDAATGAPRCFGVHVRGDDPHRAVRLSGTVKNRIIGWL